MERGKNIQDTSCIHFDRTMVLFCLAVSQVVIINVKGDLGEEMRNLLQICAYSLNKLKVSKVSAPKIFFVLNQQADPDPDKHLNAINTLLDKLNEESYLMETEGLKISELIQVSRENLFVLPSAFNSEPLNTQITKLFDSDLNKLSPTVSFANECANLRIAIIHQLKSDSCDSDSQSNFNDLKQDYKIPFKTMSEWMEMSGVIWDTIVKYQDIVKYRNTEELRCSISLNKILSNLMKQIIYFNKEKYRSITEKSICKIKDIAKWSPPKGLLEKVKEELDEIFETYQEEVLTIFAAQCQHDSLLKRMNYMCDEAKSNLHRLIYMEKKIYEDKIKFQLKSRLTEIKLKESMTKFQEDIEKNADKYFELTIEEQKREFNKVWRNCFRDNKNEEEDELYQKFDDLYSLFRMESKTMENKQTIYALFRKFNFKMDKIIQDLREQMLTKFRHGHQKGPQMEQFIYPWKENRVPIKDMTPYTGKTKCEYLNKTSLYNKRTAHGSKPNLKFSFWVPSECHPLVKYCSGYFNHPDVIWKLEKRKQIALLASHLKDPSDFKKSTWDKFINDISKSILEFTKKDPNISHSTVKEIVDLLCHICKVVNYEINFIEAKLTNVAERTISTFAFALAFKSLLKPKLEEEREIKSRQAKKEIDLKYFLQKVQNRELARGNWKRKEMRNGDLTMANKFAGDLLAAVWREVNTVCEQNVNERYFDAFRNKLSHKSILLLANEKVSKELNNIDGDNLVVEYICDHKQCLKTLFQKEWFKLAKKLHDQIIGDMRYTFTEQIAKVELVLNEFLERLLAECQKLDRLEDIGSDSDSNFEVVDETITEENACNLNPKTRFAPFNAMVFFLEIYLNPKASAEEFRNLFKGVFRVNDINIKKKNQTYVLFEKPHNPIGVLDKETFKMMSESNMFRSTETIFNIKVYVQEFLRTLNGYEYQVTKAEYENILKTTKELFEADATSCPYQCPSCGKFCEREIHPQGGKCRIMTGHQMCSMGGKVWNINKDRTAILLMCDEYTDGTQVLIPGQNLTWCEFKENYGDQWDWSLPTDEKYVVLQRENRDKMKRIWNKFGREILKYYANKGTQITYVPYTSREEIYRSLFSLNYYICFVIDGTGLMFGSINIFGKCVSEIIEETLGETVYFKIIVYHGHAVSGLKCVEKFPNNREFTTDANSIQTFLERINTYCSEGNELAMLHGLATATTETDWKSGFGVKNVIFHFYMEHTKGYFNILTARGKCDQGCQFYWERDIRDKMDALIIEYQPTVYINYSHPDYHRIKHLNEQSSTEDKSKRFKKLNPKAQIFINLKADN